MKPVPQGVARFRLWLWTALGLLAVVFWSASLIWQPFAEPPQVAVVGHDAPWRAQGPKRTVVSVGTDRRVNDIVLYDRKASPVHFELERRGGQGNWWAVLRNRSPDRAIEVRRSATPHQRIRVNRYRLRHRDRFLVPLYATTTQALDRPRDPCSPTQVHAWLRQRSLNIPASTTKPPGRGTAALQGWGPGGQHHPKQTGQQPRPKTWVALEVLRQRWRLSLQRDHARMTWGQGSNRRLLWLDQSRRFTIPAAAGGGVLEYRYNQWQIQRKNRWLPLTEPLQWGKPLRQISLHRRPQLSAHPLYQIGFVSSPCRWSVQPQSIPAGLSIGRIARLAFQGRQLVLQHLGREDLPIQVVPYRGEARHLGTTSIRSGDYISVGQLTYRVTIQRDRVRLMLTRLPQNHVFPLRFFQDYPSEQYTMRHWLRSAPDTGADHRSQSQGNAQGQTASYQLLLTGGEGAQAGTQRWRLPLSLAGTPGKTQIASPYAPFLLLRHLKHDRYQVAPVGDVTIYTATPQGRFLKQQIARPTEIKAGTHLLYAQRLYLRIFQPSYGGLTWRIALLWLLVAGGAVLFLHWRVATGRLSLAPFTSPANQHATSPVRLRKSWFAILWLWPVALFLNGLGLYVLAALSLSSLGLNNNSFLYRQFLWSLVGVILFVVWLGGAALWTPLREFIQTRIPAAWKNLWYRLFPPAAPGVQLLSTPPPSTLQRRVWIAASLLYLGTCLAVGLVFQSLSVLLPAFLLYLYVVLLTWEYRRNRFDQSKQRSLRFFFLTLLLLGLVPFVGFIAPGLVHNRFFLIVPGLGTVKVSEFAILTALVFFAHYLGLEIFAIRRIKLAREQSERRAQPSSPPESKGETAATSHETSSSPPVVVILNQDEVNVRRQRWERLGGALLVGLLYLLLLGAIGALYTVQGDLGPGLILTCCFSLYLLFAFLSTGADRLTTIGNLLRIATVFLGFAMLFWLPSLLAALFPDWAAQSSELQKVHERLALWNQPWRFVVGEQILQNLWNLAGHHGAFQWFNNLHSDFVLTAVVRVLSTLWGYLLIGLTCMFPLATLTVARHYWTTPSPSDSPATLQQHQQNTIRALLILFGGIYLFAQNLIHVGSVLRITPMTGVTFTWVSSGGTSLIVCYLVLAMIHRQLRVPTQKSAQVQRQL